jgi:hypothetical protein
MPRVRRLLTAPDPREIPRGESGRASELGERHPMECREDLAGEHLRIYDRSGMRNLPLLQLPRPPSGRRSSPLGHRPSVRRIDPLRAPLRERSATGLGEGLVAVTLVVRGTVVAVDPGPIEEFPAAALAARLRPRRSRLGWCVGVVVAAGAVGAAVRLGQRRRQLLNGRLALEDQRCDALGDGRDQLPPAGRVSASSWVSGASSRQLPRCVS